MWPVNCEKVGNQDVLSRSTDTESKYGAYDIVSDPIPISQIQESGIRFLKRNDIDINGLRAYKITHHKPTNVQAPTQSSKPRVLINLTNKRPLTHAICKAEEEKKP